MREHDYVSTVSVSFESNDWAKNLIFALKIDYIKQQSYTLCFRKNATQQLFQILNNWQNLRRCNLHHLICSLGTLMELSIIEWISIRMQYAAKAKSTPVPVKKL